MQTNGTSVQDRTQVVGPVVAGSEWFEAGGRPFTVRMAFPLSFADMVAALFAESGMGMTREDLATAEDVFGHIAVTVTTFGLTEIEAHARDIEHKERTDSLTVAEADWLEFVRQQVTAAIADGMSR